MYIFFYVFFFFAFERIIKSEFTYQMMKNGQSEASLISFIMKVT